MDDTQQIKCAKCNVAIEGFIVDGETEGKCPVCGVSDNLENIKREVGEYVRDKAAESLSASMKKAARGSKVMTFRENKRPKKQHRFIVDLDL